MNIEGQFNSSKPHSGVESIKFDDGDLIVGTLGDDDGMTFYSTSGNDLIYTFDGDDVLEGGVGNDTLHGGAGNDIYHFAIGEARVRRELLENDSLKVLQRFIFKQAA